MTTALHYLLDTNILSALLRDPSGRIAKRIDAVGEGAVCTSIIVASEMRYCVRKRGSLRLAEHVEAVLSAIPVLAFTAPASLVLCEYWVERDTPRPPPVELGLIRQR